MSSVATDAVSSSGVGRQTVVSGGVERGSSFRLIKSPSVAPDRIVGTAVWGRPRFPPRRRFFLSGIVAFESVDLTDNDATELIKSHCIVALIPAVGSAVGSVGPAGSTRPTDTDQLSQQRPTNTQQPQ
jgi:hypothetical protein